MTCLGKTPTIGPHRRLQNLVEGGGLLRASCPSPLRGQPFGCSNLLQRIRRTCDLSVVRIHLLTRFVFPANWWREVDSNHRRRKPADLQSAPVGRLGIPPESRSHDSEVEARHPEVDDIECLVLASLRAPLATARKARGCPPTRSRVLSGCVTPTVKVENPGEPTCCGARDAGKAGVQPGGGGICLNSATCCSIALDRPIIRSA